MNRVYWYYNRIKKMSFFEVLYRFWELMLYFVIVFKYRNGWSDKKGKKIKVSKSIAKLVKTSMPTDFPENNFEVLPFDNDVYFKSLTIDKDFDLRKYWESNRFTGLFLFSKEDDKEKYIYDYLECWMGNNKPMKGVNYISVMECSIRCINLFSVLCYLKENNLITERLENLCLNFFATNYNIIRSRVSLYSSRGNHTLFEYAGILVCSYALSKNSVDKYRLLFLNEFCFQVNEDGSGIEQSTSYHFFNFQLAFIISKMFYLGQDFDNKFGKAKKFLSYFVVNNRFVRFGDCDSSSFYVHSYLLNDLGDNSNFKEYPVNFPNAGVSIIRPDNITCYLKHGSLGMPPLYGHGHYDFLSVVLVMNDGTMLSHDSQTYLYNCISRAEIRSSKYHSMPMYGSDDITQLSKFSWESGRSGQLLNLESSKILAEYTRRDGNVLRRKVEIAKEHICVIDYLSTNSTNKIGVNNLSVGWVSKNNKHNFTFFKLVDDEKLVSISPACEELILSNKYGNLEKESLSRIIVSVEPSCKLVTLFSIGDTVSKKDVLDKVSDVRGDRESA